MKKYSAVKATPKSEQTGPTTKATSTQVKAKIDTSELDSTKQELLAECEKDINLNLRATFVVGWRLEQIRDQKLYLATHDTFAQYCKERWDFTKTHANRQIQAYLCEKHLKQAGDEEVYIPTKESQVRYIVDLEPDQWVEVAAKVKANVGEGIATAGDFGAARQELFPKPKTEPKVKKANTGEIKAEAQFDTNLVSFAKLKQDADRLYTIFTSPTGKQEGLKIISGFQKMFDQLADLQAVQLEEAA